MEGYQLDHITFRGEGWIVANTCDPQILALLRTIYTNNHTHEHGHLVPDTRINFLALEAIGAPTSVTAAYRCARRRTVVGAFDPKRAMERLCQLGENEFACGLLPHQVEFLAFATSRRVALNASEQGTGKTRMALGAALLWGCRRTLVIAPKEVADEWQSSLQCLNRPPTFLNLTEGSVAQRVGHLRRVCDQDAFAHQLAVVNYDVLPTMREELAAWRPDLVVADESWKIKTPSAQRTRAALWITSRPTVGPFRLCLAGTPIGNDVGDLWAQLRFLDRGLAAETHRQWLQRFAVMEALQVAGRTIQKPIGVRDPVGLMSRLEQVWFRATKEGCLRLPPKVRRTVKLPLSAPARTLYRAVQRDGDAALGNDLALTSPAVKALRLQQIAGGHRPVPLEYWDGEGPREAAWAAAERLPCHKAHWITQWAEVNLAPHPSVRAIVFCRFSAEVLRVANLLGSLLGEGKVAGVTGGGGPFPKEGQQLTTVKASFNSRSPDGVQVLVCQVKKMAAGHNLQSADHVIYFSNSWSLIDRVQSEDRAHRQGREDVVQYWDLVCDETVDEEILAALVAKRDFSIRMCRDTAGGNNA